MTAGAARVRPRRPAPALPLMKAAIMLAPLALAACVGFATPEREVLWTPFGTYTREAVPPPP